jgi:hypothetical protein
LSLHVVNAAESPPRPKGRVDIVTSVSAEVTEEFLSLYRVAFDPIALLSPARQSLTDDEFRREMADPSVLKFVARDPNEAIIALACMATDLKTVPWISEPYFANRFPEHHARGAIFYFGAMLVRSDRQGGPWATYLLEHIAYYLAERDGIGCFDSCGFYVDTVGMPELVSRATHRLVRLDLQLLDRQEYYAGVVEGFK